jgi:hypothetical protein
MGRGRTVAAGDEDMGGRQDVGAENLDEMERIRDRGALKRFLVLALACGCGFARADGRKTGGMRRSL